MSAPVLISWRTLIAALAAFAWVALVRRRAIWLGTRNVLTLVGVGLVIGCHWLAFFGSIKLSNISICLAGMATISLFTAFTEPLILRRRVRPFEVLLGVIVLAGIALIAGLEKNHLTGLAVALAAAALAAIFPVLNRTLVNRGGDPLTMVGWEMLGACLACLAALPFFDRGGYPALFVMRDLDWLWILLLALVCTVFAQALHIHLLRRLSAYTANLACNFEPVYGILAAALVFAEYKSLHPAFYLGVLAIVLVNFLHPVLERRARLPVQQ